MRTNIKKKIIFIHTPCYELENDCLEPPIGILYLATMLRNEGISCKVCDLSGIPEKKWKDLITEGDIYAFSTYSVTYNRTLKIRDIIKREINPKAITIAGGPHVSSLPNESSKDFDIIIIGEAEITFLNIVKSINNGENLKGVFEGVPVENLDTISFPDYSLIDLDSYNRIVEGVKSISLLTSRGCKYNCAFCNSRVFSRGKVRFRSPNNVVEEIKSLKEKYGINSFRFNDDLFTFSPERIEEMTEALKPLNIFYRIFARSDSLINKELCNNLYDSGCRHISIGIESMSKKMLRLLDKKATVNANIEALRNTKSSGLKTRIYLIVGFPGETIETIQESLNNLLKCDFDEFIVYPFIPYPGTPVWYNPEKWDAQIDKHFENYVQVGKGRNTCYAVTTKNFTPEDVRCWRQIMIDSLERKGAIWAGTSSDNR